STPNVIGSGLDWLFDIDTLTRTINYEPIIVGTQFNGFRGTKASDNAGQPRKETKPVKNYILLPLWTFDLPYPQDPKSSHDDGSKPSSDDENKVDEDPRKYSECNDQEKEDNVNNTNTVNVASTNKVNVVGRKTSIEVLYDFMVYQMDVKSASFSLFLAYASFKDFMVYQMDVKSVFLYGKIEEEVYVCQPPGFEDPNFPDRVYKKELCNAFEKLMHEKFQMSSMGELTFFLGLQVQQKKDGIFISQDKYVDEILKKFGFTKVKTASTPMETQKPLLKNENGEEVDVHIYQVNPKVSHLHAVKRIFRYLKDQPKLGLWYLKDSSFDLVAYTDSDYAEASLDRKSTIGGCQFLRCRLLSWQCKKHTVVANSTTEAEYVDASSYYGQVLWIQNQLLDYGYNFMHTNIFIDNNRKAKKSVKLMMEKLFGMELELMLAPQPSDPTRSVADEAVHKELGDSLVRDTTTASSLEAEQDS
ncbi:uncharacterized mitochondrial protein-like protein, partial [Tanacetum coccineum]